MVATAHRNARFLVLALQILLSACSGSSKQGAETKSLPTAPVKMTLPRLDGGTLAIESLRGRPVLITLFTTWWVRCQLEAPAFVRFDERFRSEGLAVVGIALDAGGNTPAKLVSLYVEEVGFRFPVLLAAPDNLDLVAGLGATRAVPRTILLDRQGRIVHEQVGATRFQVLETKILELLGKR